MAQADLDIATQLSSVIPSLTLGTNLFAGPIRPFSPSSDAQVFCLLRPGRSDEVFHEESSGAFRHLAYPSVQVFVRSATTFQSGQVLAESIFEAINHKPVVGYVEWSITSSAPIYLGREDDQHHEWSINVDTTIDEDVA